MAAASGLKREIGLWQGTALNVIDMVGIGPFVTLPLVLMAMGGGRGLGAWMLGALLAICDGLVTAELSAQLPRAGGAYAFLKEAYGAERWGRWLSFLFLFQIVFSAPLSMASGAIGFSRYLRYVFPGIPEGLEAPVASVLCVLITLGLCRRIGTIGKLSVVLWAGTLLTLAIVIGLGLPHLKLEAFAFWEAPLLPRPDGRPLGAFGGTGEALILTIYAYLGYYNICFVAEEVVEPTKTIPRVIVLSILVVAALYILMNACVVSVLPTAEAMASKSTVSDYVGHLAGKPVARLVTVLILWTAFGSVFSLTLGYSRVLWAAARDGAFFKPFARLHATEGYPVVAVLALGGVATIFAWLPLKHVVSAILSIRAIVPFIAQVVAALVLRRTRPDAERPFRMWLYPVPALVALALWTFVLVSPEKGFKATGLLVIVAGTTAFLLRQRAARAWPFAPVPPAPPAAPSES